MAGSGRRKAGSESVVRPLGSVSLFSILAARELSFKVDAKGSIHRTHGEVVTLDENGKPFFNLLQNSTSGADLHFFIFDVLVLNGNDIMSAVPDQFNPRLQPTISESRSLKIPQVSGVWRGPKRSPG
jgi:hypothetical protein